MNNFRMMSQEELQTVNGGGVAKTVEKIVNGLEKIGGAQAIVDAIGEAGKSFADGFKEAFN